jgi:UDP-N-acetylglucosamine--N-acetylmuramyl-(pentapeptide) pyrophosphoryl-undecaprenol N-acetylglucosamine transferase
LASINTFKRKQFMKTQSIAFVAGRSGGHIIPALTLAHTIKKIDPLTHITLISTATPLDKQIMQEHDGSIDCHHMIKLPNVNFFNPLKFFSFVIRTAQACIKSIIILKAAKPDRVIGMGGSICIPVCLAARFLRIPIQLYDFDAKPGKATRFLARSAQTIYVCFEQAKQHLPAAKCIIIDYPIRFDPALIAIRPPVARAHLKLMPNKKTIFINGGSQGSAFMNQCMKEWLELNPHLHSLIQIIHQTGNHSQQEWAHYYKQAEIPAITFAYHHDMAPFYAAADVIICRAGAGSLFEALFFKKPCITIPLETTSTSHQRDNARALAYKYPELITMLSQQEFKHDNMILFRLLNKYIYAQPNAPHLYSVGKLVNMR